MVKLADLRRFGAYGIIVFVLMNISCGSIQSRNELIGTYELVLETQKLMLELFPNGSFSETIITNTGQSQKYSGLWGWGGALVTFDGLIIPEMFPPAFIDPLDASGNSYYASPGHYSITPGKRWGKVVLPISDDLNLVFAKK